MLAKWNILSKRKGMKNQQHERKPSHVRAYLDKHGFTIKAFAKRLNIPSHRLSVFLCYGYIPRKYWIKIEKATDSEIVCAALKLEYEFVIEERRNGY